MSLTSIKNMSPFGQSALALDSDFGELERLSAQIERLSADSESELDHARKLLARFSECGQRIGEGVQSMAKALEEARARAEKAAEVVSNRAALIQKRQEEAEQMLARFQTLAEMVRKVTAAVSQIQKPKNGEFSTEEKVLLLKHLPEINGQLGVLIDEASKLREDAQVANLKTLEKNADSMSQSLLAVRSKLNVFVDQSAMIH